MTGGQVLEPALADVQREFPGWECEQGANGLCYATHAATGTQVCGEDPLDLRDQITAAERLRGYDQDTGPASADREGLA